MNLPPVLPHTFATPGGELAASYCPPPARTDREASAVLVGGLYGSKEDFYLLMPYLAQAGYHAYAYDHRGQHESAGPDDPSAYSLEDLTRDLRALLPQIRHTHAIHLVGLCMGGFVARAAASQQEVSSLTVIGWHLDNDRSAARRLRAAAVVSQRIGPSKTLRLATRIADRKSPHPPLDAVYQQVSQKRLSTTSPAHYMGLTRAWAAALQSDHPRTLPAPTLILNGSDDQLFQSERFSHAARRLGAAHTVIPDTGHLVQLHRPEAVADALLQFWEGLPDGRDVRGVGRQTARRDPKGTAQS